MFWGTIIGEPNLAESAERVKEALGDSGAVISSLGVFGNPLETEPKDIKALRTWEICMDNTHLFGADIVSGFAGGLRDQPRDVSIPRFKEVFGPLDERAADQGVRIAVENCPMGGD